MNSSAKQKPFQLLTLRSLTYVQITSGRQFLNCSRSTMSNLLLSVLRSVPSIEKCYFFLSKLHISLLIRLTEAPELLAIGLRNQLISLEDSIFNFIIMLIFLEGSKQNHLPEPFLPTHFGEAVSKPGIYFNILLHEWWNQPAIVNNARWLRLGQAR